MEDLLSIGAADFTIINEYSLALNNQFAVMISHIKDTHMLDFIFSLKG